MRVIILTFCLIGAVFANPISFNALVDSSESGSNTTESLSASQSTENDISQLQSSEDTTSSQSQSSESESLETTSEDTTSEESNSQSDENQTDSMAETRDNSMSSEENVRRSGFASVTKALSAEDNSTEVTQLSDTNLPLVENSSVSSDTTSSETNDLTGVTATNGTNDSSDSNSSESNETSESIEDSSNASDSNELAQIKTQDCVNGTQSCESDEYFFQDIGDDAHYPTGNLMVPEETERELHLRR